MHHISRVYNTFATPLPSTLRIDQIPMELLHCLNIGEMQGDVIDFYTAPNAQEYGKSQIYKLSYPTQQDCYTLGLFDCLGLAIYYENSMQIWHIGDLCYTNKSPHLFSRSHLYHIKRQLSTYINNNMIAAYIIWWNIHSFSSAQENRKKYIDWVSNIGNMIKDIARIDTKILYWPHTQPQILWSYHNLHMSMDCISVHRMYPQDLWPQDPLFESISYKHIQQHL